MPYSNSFFKSAASKILLPVIFLFLSCKKELAIIEPVQNEFSQKNEQLFFNKQHVQNATILRIIDDLKSKNSIEPFIDNLMPGAGYPRWDKTLITNDKTVHRSVSAPLDSTYIIPMVDASNSFVTGALIAYVGDTISYVATAMNDYRQLAINKTEYSKC